MDRLRRAKRIPRGQITRICNEIDAELQLDPLDKATLAAKLARLEQVEKSLCELDIEMQNLMLDDEDFSDQDLDSEAEVARDYSEKVSKYKFKTEKALHPSRPTSPNPSETSYNTATTTGGNKKTYKLPKIDLKKFNGDLTEWIGWWSQFEKIHEDEALHDSDKFQYLLQAVVDGSRAQKLVQSYPPSTANYPKVIEALKDRFGDEVLLAEVYVRKLLSFVNRSGNQMTVSMLYDDLESHLRSLESLGVTTKESSVFLYPMIESCLPEEIIKVWQRSATSGYSDDSKKTPQERLQALMKFIKQEVQGAERLSFVKSGVDEPQKERQPRIKFRKEKTPTSAGLHTATAKTCVFCDKPHESVSCKKAATMTLEERRERVQKKHLCFGCFKPGHSANKCNSAPACYLCSKPHNIALCPVAENQKSDKRSESRNKSESSSTPKAEEIKTGNVNLNYTGEVLLKTLLVRVIGNNGITHTARLLLDDGSQHTYVKESTAKLLGYEPIGETAMRQSLFGGVVTEVKRVKKYAIKIADFEGKNHRVIKAYSSQVVCGDIPRVPRGQWLKDLQRRKIFLSDFQSESEDIEILIGSDYWESIMTGELVSLNNGLTARGTIFGWTVSGAICESSVAMQVTNVLFNRLENVPDFWNLELLGITDPIASKTKEEKDKEVKKHFLETVSRKADGRYTVSLPWTNGIPTIPTNRIVAEKRLLSATTTLNKKGKFADYEKIFESWLEEGIIEEVKEPNADTTSNCHYIPHKAVFKPESRTTPIRPVFDASCKMGRNPSLNECLEKGPNLLELIPQILLRFREKRIGVISDVRKAFQMIEVKEEDRDYLRFLWWEDFTRRIYKVYRHARVVFGVNCSPFQLGAVLEFHLGQVQDEDKQVAQKLLKSLYVDNSVTSFDTEEEYQDFRKRAVKIMSDAKMELRQWECSTVEVSGVSPLTSRGCGLDTGSSDTSNLDAEEEELTTVLGYKWDKLSDTLFCDIDMAEAPEKTTKRFVLSSIQKIFDPIGFTCPVLLQPKILLQKTWEDKVDWDEDINEDFVAEFKKWYEDIMLLRHIRIPRNATGFVSSRDHWEIHGFCDASQDAYAAVIFLRTEINGVVSVQLLQAKSRVAPLKKHKPTIPRLELLGCLIGARLFKAIKEGLSLDEDIPCVFWSDSTTALAWIRRNDDLGTFVGNRVREVCTLTNPLDWRHVPGHLNPADLPSRGCTPRTLLESRWWEGPAWLKLDKSQWPSEEGAVDEDEVGHELKKKPTPAATVTEPQPPWYEPPFSTYSKNIRVMGWVLRFVKNSRNKEKDRIMDNHLRIQEIRDAEKEVLHLIQQQNFPNDFKAVKKRDNKVMQVQGIKVEWMKEDRLLHVHSKLSYRDDDHLFRYPILLPKDDPIVHQLIQEAHHLYCHSGAQFLLGKLREKYWILQGRRAVKNVIHKCVKCRRFDAKPLVVEPSALPEKRVATSEAFETTGVDLAGPLYITENGRVKKVWIVLFTCAVYRGVFLDLVTSLSTEAFLGSLQRFINDHGRPNTIFSDNGTNFVGTANLFKRINWTKVEKESQVKRIQWNFNPPTGAWWGGWWERLIRSVKDLLRRVLGNSRLSYDEMRTCLSSVSAIINNRPLTTITEDPEDLIPLTPAMFFRGTRDTSFPESSQVTARELQQRYKRMDKIQKDLVKRFRSEYLSQLVQCSKDKKTPNPKVGDIVFVGADNKKRQEWPLGRIIELLPGKDNEIRVAKVKTKTGVFLRPLQRLYPAEVPTGQLTISEEVKKIALEEVEDIHEQDEIETTQDEDRAVSSSPIVPEPQPETRTRSGRKVVKTQRYGQWNN